MSQDNTIIRGREMKQSFYNQDDIIMQQAVAQLENEMKGDEL